MALRRLAVSEINAAGGVLGKTLVHNRNPDWDETKVQSLAHELADAGIGVAIGPTASKLSMAGATVALQRSILVTSHLRLVHHPAPDDRPRQWILLPHHSLRRPAGAGRGPARLRSRLAEGRHHLRAPRLRRGAVRGLRLAFTALGGTVTRSEAYPVEDTETGADYNGLVRRALASEPETIVLIAYAVEGAEDHPGLYRQLCPARQVLVLHRWLRREGVHHLRWRGEVLVARA